MKAKVAGVLLLLSGCATGRPVEPQIQVSADAAARSCIIHPCGKPPVDLAAAPSREDKPAYVNAVEAGGTDSARVAPDVELGNPEIRLLLRASVGAPLEILALGDALPVSGQAGGPHVIVGELIAADGTKRGLFTERVSMFASEDGSATVTVFGHDGKNAQLHATTTFKLARGDRAVLVSTTLENTGTANADAADVNDRVTWSGRRAFVPGSTHASAAVDAREFSGPYVSGIGDHDSVAFTSTEGEVSATLDKEEARIHLARALALGPRSQRSFDRVIVVGSRADSSSVVAELLRASGLATGVVRVSVYSPQETERAVTIPMPQELVVRVGGADALTVRMPNATFDVELPEGTFTIRSRSQPESAGVPVTIHAGLVANISVPLAR